jgi:hypothetical protein
VGLLLIAFVMLTLCACEQIFSALGAEDAKTPSETALAWAEDHAELLGRCGEELLANYPETPKWTGAEFEVSIIKDDWIELWHPQSRELIDFHSEDCRILLEEEAVESVSVEPAAVCFSLGGRGFGSQTDYYDVWYVPSDDVTACFGWSKDMTFTEQNGGRFGRLNDPQDDNTFFYLEIGAHLYFCIAHF